MSRRRRRKSGKYYSLRQFLEKQPKTIRRYPGYSALYEYLSSNRELQQIRISSRCYKVLDKAILPEENLQDFYRTYRLKPHPFYPLYLNMKKKYLSHRLELEEKRQNYILKKMKTLPEQPGRFIRTLAELEKKLNRSGDYPLWSQKLYPGSKKKADQYSVMSNDQWITVFNRFLHALSGKYKPFSTQLADRYLAAYILELPIRDFALKMDKEQVKKAYRISSKRHHPDSGGDSELFLTLQWAKDLFLNS